MRPIYLGLSPNLELDDFWLALKLLVTGETNVTKTDVEHWFNTYLGNGSQAVTFNSGRSAEWAILKALEVGEGDEVLVQAFTCVAVPNSVLWLRAKPVYVDIEKNGFNMDPKDLEKKITKNSKIVIVQHTFGKPADLNKIQAICRKHNLVLIEDCAHALGATYTNQKVGTFGAAAFFSLGRDKVISSVFGGVATTTDSELANKLKAIQHDLPESGEWWIYQQLLQPIFTGLLMPLYNLKLGKLGLWFLQKIGVMSLPVYELEKQGLQPSEFPTKYSNLLATLGLKQLKKLERFNQHRLKLVKIYSEGKLEEGNIYLRYSLITDKAKDILTKAKHKGWVLGDWYNQVIVPVKNYQDINYILGSCPRAEETAGKVINLPTYIGLSEKQATEIWQEVQKWLN